MQKIRQLLRERGLAAVRVGTVDDFQGQEAHIVFISTVLSSSESLPAAHPQFTCGAKGPAEPAKWWADGADAQHLGFWRNPKRFNVAITRARALLVVVGHPVVLMEVGLCSGRAWTGGVLGIGAMGVEVGRRSNTGSRAADRVIAAVFPKCWLQ